MNQKIAHDHLGLPATGLAEAENLSDCELADQGRRRFVGLNLLGLAVASTASLLLSEDAWALRTKGAEDDTPAILDPKDPQAHALNYTRESRKEKQSCSNCQLYTGTAGDEVGPCAIFSYRVAPNGKQILVDATGWCRAWAARQEP